MFQTADTSNNSARPTSLSPDKKPSPEASPQDRGDILFGKYIAHKLTYMDPIQARIAEKLISEVLFEAEMGTLNRHIKLVEIPPHSPQPLPLHPNVNQAHQSTLNREPKNVSVPLSNPLTIRERDSYHSSPNNKTSLPEMLDVDLRLPK